MSQNAPLSAFSMHFVSSNCFGTNVNPTCKSPHLLKRRFPAMEHRINERASGTIVIGYPGGEAQLPKQQTGALSK
jgi:hypothetical protein